MILNSQRISVIGCLNCNLDKICNKNKTFSAILCHRLA